MTALFCVLHKDPDYSAERTADFLAVERGLSRTEAAAAFKKSPGFLLENAELGKSSAFNLRASAFGFETLLLPQKKLKSPPPASVLSKIEFSEDGFFYLSSSLRERLPFEAIKFIAAGAFGAPRPANDAAEPETDALSFLRRRYFPFALPVGEKHNSPTEMQRTPQMETVFQADILTGGPEQRRLTIACDDLDYSALGAKKSLSSFENFRVLLEELASRAPEAATNRFLRALVGKKTLSGLRCPSAAAYEKELIWLLTILQ